MIGAGDYKRVAQARLAPSHYDFVAGGAGTEMTVEANVDDWRRMQLRPHVLRDVRAVSTACRVLGTALQAPFGVAPMAAQGLFQLAGDVDTAAAATDAGCLFVAAERGSRLLEEVAEVADAGWFQVYLQSDRGYSRDLIERALAAGYTALMVTVDVPTNAKRPRDLRNGFDAGVAKLGNLIAEDDRYVPGGNPDVTFDDITWLAELLPVPVVVKGVLRGDDATACVEAGASAVVVSNHGGRQLDTAISSARALPEVVSAVGDRADVYVDGGIRTGEDALKAFALGARLVLLGRPVIWALAAAGRTGVRDLLTMMTNDLARSMALSGIDHLDHLTSDLVAEPGGHSESQTNRFSH